MQPTWTLNLILASLWATTAVALPFTKILPRDKDKTHGDTTSALRVPYSDIGFGLGFGTSMTVLDHLSSRHQSGPRQPDVVPPDTSQQRPQIQSMDDVSTQFSDDFDYADALSCIGSKVSFGQIFEKLGRMDGVLLALSRVAF